MAKKTAAAAKKTAKTAKIFCPCCPTWEIKRPERCSNTLTHKGKKLYFCTTRCRERFEKNPAKFV